MLHCLTIWAILINIAYGVNQDCYFIPDPRLACVEFISLSKGVHGCKHLKDSVLVTGISKEWIEIIEINGVVIYIFCYIFDSFFLFFYIYIFYFINFLYFKLLLHVPFFITTLYFKIIKKDNCNQLMFC